MLKAHSQPHCEKDMLALPLNLVSRAYCLLKGRELAARGIELLEQSESRRAAEAGLERSERDERVSRGKIDWLDHRERYEAKSEPLMERRRSQLVRRMGMKGRARGETKRQNLRSAFATSLCFVAFGLTYHGYDSNFASFPLVELGDPRQ